MKNSNKAYSIVFQPLFLLLLLLTIGSSWAESIRIVHFSDPHLFEKVSNRNKEEPINALTFRQAIRQANKLEDIKFAALSGDIGIEQLLISPDGQNGKASTKILNDFIKTTLKKDLTVDSLSEDDFHQILTATNSKQRWESAVKTVAKLIGESIIKTWWLVPGNNDLWNEFDTTIVFYRQFVKAVAQAVKPKGIDVIDFSQGSNGPGTHILRLGGKNYLFAGLNNASFKNNGKVERLLKTKELSKPQPGYFISSDSAITKVQLENLQSLQKTLDSQTHDFAYLFFHIPEIDDPWTVTKKGKKNAQDRGSQWQLLKNLNFELSVDEGYEYSAWLVAPKVRQQWINMLKNQRIKGLLSGHFHADERQTYQDLSDWQETTKEHKNSYPGLSRLHVVPPIAVKNGNTGARGFQLLSIDDKGAVTRTLYWYEGSDQAFY